MKNAKDYPEMAAALASCVKKVLANDPGLTFVTTAKAGAFLEKYMHDPAHTWEFKAEAESAKKDNYRERVAKASLWNMFKDKEFLSRALDGLSSNEAKVFLDDELRMFYFALGGRDDGPEMETEFKNDAMADNQKTETEPRHLAGGDDIGWAVAVDDELREVIESLFDDGDKKPRRRKKNEDKNNKA